jgi:hypothetical protein
VATDNFTRADETPLSTNSWASDAFGGVNLISNTVGNSSVADKCSYRTDSAVFDSQVKIATTGDKDGGPAICINGSSSFYCANNNSGSNIEMFKVTAGSFSAIGSFVGTYATNDLIRIRRSGGNVIISQNGTDIITVADSSFVTGNDGIHCFNTIRMDDWTNNVADGGGTPTSYFFNDSMEMS